MWKAGEQEKELDPLRLPTGANPRSVRCVFITPAP